MSPIFGSPTVTLVLKLALSGVILLVIAAVCGLLILAIRRLLTVKTRREHVIRLVNQGNVHSVWQIAADSPDELLKFQLLQNGVPLVELPVDLLPQAVVAAQPAAPALSGNGKDHAPVGPSQAAQAQLDKAPAGQGLKDAGKTATATAGAAAALLGTAGSLLPGSAGSALKGQSSALRGVQAQTSAAMRAPEETQRKVETLQSDARRLAVGQKRSPDAQVASVSSQRAVMAMDASEPYPPDVPSPEYNPQGGPARGAGRRFPTLPRYAACVQTAELSPGSRQDLALRITPRKPRFPEGSYLYKLTFQQIPLEKLNRDAQPVTKQGAVYLKPADAWRFWLRGILTAVVIIAALAAMFALATLIW